MLKKICMSTMTLVLLSGVSSSFAHAEGSESKEEKIEEARSYIEESKKDTINLLKDLEKENATLESVEKTLDKYYEENPAPKEVINDQNLSLEDVFPGEVERIEEETLNLNKFMSEKENDVARENDNGEFIEFKNGENTVDVYVGETGGVFVLETKTIDEPSNKSLINATSEVGALATKTTSKRKTTGICYNALGAKMFTLWSLGSFKYTGKTVSVATKDGGWQRHFWGSTLNVSKPILGATRSESVGSEKYAEVYSRIYFESVFGLKWAGVTMKSGTVETYVGGSKTGGMYGSARKVK